MKSLIIGYGSIGQRHAKILKRLSSEVAVMSNRAIDYVNSFSNLETAILNYKPDYIVLANKTSEHYQILKELTELEFKGCVLIEKPLFDHIKEIPDNNFSLIAIGYNLRFHKLVIKLKALLNNIKLVTSTIYVGSYLPNWRTSIDYRQSYSARKELGGGVLRDLSHELDLVLWLFGSWTSLTASGGNYSNMEINSDDCFSIIMQTTLCPLVTVHMNYLDRSPHRSIIINTEKSTLEIDLIKNVIIVDGIAEAIECNMEETYIAEHEAIMSANLSHLCNLKEAIETLVTIESIEKAAKEKKWIKK